MAFIKNIEKLRTVALRNSLEKRVGCLSGGLNALVGTLGTPACLSYLRGVYNVLATIAGLTDFLDHVCLNLTEKNGALLGIEKVCYASGRLSPA
jgi:hypothetical protein